MDSHEICVLLVDDQPIIAEGVRRMLEGQEHIALHYCSDPTKAIEMALDVKPTVILQDLVMPQVDGLVLLRYFRAHPELKEVPLIVLSTKEEPVIKAEAFSLGANDYLVKLPDKVELIARISHHSKGYISLLERNEAYTKLQESQEALLSELAKAADYVSSLLPETMEEPFLIRSRFIPSEALGGDAFGYHWIDEDHFALYVLDVSGHGVGAALLSVSVMNVLKAASMPDCDFYDPQDVLTRLNATFPMEQQNNMFFTAWYGVYKKSTCELTYSSGGHPPAMLIGPEEPKQLATQGLVIGAMEDAEFNKATCTIPKGSKLFVYSDGAFELHSPEGKLLRFDDFVPWFDTLPGTADEDLDYLIQKARNYQGLDAFEDDYSILVCQF